MAAKLKRRAGSKAAKPPKFGKQAPKASIEAGRSALAAAQRCAIFVEAYIANGENATQAAIQAGFSPRSAHTSAYRMLRKAEVVDAIAKRRAELANRYKLTTDAVLAECARIVYSDPRRLFDEAGRLRAVKDLEPEVAATVASIEIKDARGDEPATTKVRLWDKNAAIDKAMRYLGLYEADNRQRGPFAGLVDRMSPAELEHVERFVKEALGALAGHAEGAAGAAAERPEGAAGGDQQEAG